MRLPLFAFGLLVSQIGCVQTEKPHWEPILNGKDLKGWTIKIAGHNLGHNYKNTFIVEDGMLKVNYDEYENFDDKFGHIYFDQPYSHYRVRLEYRFVGDVLPGSRPWNNRNSGIMLHSQTPETVTKNQEFPVSLEMQLLGGLGTEERTTGNLCSPGVEVNIDGISISKHCINSNSKTYHGDQWVSAEAIVLGDSMVHHVINGDTILTYENPTIGTEDWIKKRLPESQEYWIEKIGMPLEHGHIALQSEGHVIHFRNIEIMDLSSQFVGKSKY